MRIGAGAEAGVTRVDILFRIDTMLLPCQELINVGTGIAEIRRGCSRKRKITVSFPCTSRKHGALGEFRGIDCVMLSAKIEHGGIEVVGSKGLHSTYTTVILEENDLRPAWGPWSDELVSLRRVCCLTHRASSSASRLEEDEENVPHEQMLQSVWLPTGH